MLKRLQLVALALGIGFFAYLVVAVGADTIFRDLERIGWGLAAVILIELVVDAFNTRGWWHTFAPADRRTGLPFLFLVRLAGTAFNQVIPSATVGGEPVKVMLLRPHVPVSSAVASVLTAKLSYAVGQAIFVFLGLLLTSYRFGHESGVIAGVWAALALTALGLGVFLWLQHRGLFASAARSASLLRLPQRWIARMLASTAEVDHRIRALYRERPLDFVLSVGWHLTSFCLGTVQIYLLMRWLGLDATLVDALAVEAFSILIQLALFLVPGSIGVQEGGKVLIFTALGLPAAAGLSVGIAMRLNQIVGIALGLAAYAALQRRQRGHDAARARFAGDVPCVDGTR